MDLRRAGIIALLFVGSAAAATAQGTSRANAADASAEARQHQSADPDAIDVTRLGLNVDRIHKKLRQTTVREEVDGLHLRYSIDVYGRAPAIQLFTKQDNLVKGPVPWGAPSHADMLQIMTPQEFRAPAADFGALFKWLADKAGDKK